MAHRSYRQDRVRNTPPPETAETRPQPVVGNDGELHRTVPGKVNTSLLAGGKIADKMLFKQFGLKKHQRAVMLMFGLALSQIAVPIGSSLYFLFTQAHYLVQYPQPNGSNGSLVNVWLKDSWDRLPVHIDNFLGTSTFTTQQSAPEWWVTARHDFRHVLIGFLAALLIGAITVGLKSRKRATPFEMAMSVPVALAVAGVITAGMIALFNYVLPFVNHWGFVSSNPYLSNMLGKGTIQLTVIGLVAGIGAKLVLARTFDTIQLMSLERNIAQGESERWWWKFVYPPNYRQRFKLLVNAGYQCEAHSRWLGITLSLAAPVLVFLAVFGIWLTYAGPAAGAN